MLNLLNDTIPRGQRISCVRYYELTDLVAYTLIRNLFLDSKLKFSALIDNCNKITAKLEDLCPTEKKILSDLRLAVQNATIGEATSDFSFQEHINLFDNSTQFDQMHMAKCKEIYRVLAQRLHPDKGGDADLFAAVNKAMREGDLEFLAVQEVLLIHESKYDWRAYEGLDFWIKQIEMLPVREQKLKASPIFKIVREYQSGKIHVATKHMKELLEHKIIATQTELNYMVVVKRHQVERAMQNVQFEEDEDIRRHYEDHANQTTVSN